MTHQTKHRHFLVAPLIAAALVVSMLPAAYRASLLDGGSEISSTAYEDGTYVHAFDKSQFEAGTRTLREGTALIMSEGIGEVRAGGFTFVNYAGAYHLTRYGDEVTVAALTSPVMLEQKGTKLLLPIGKQWRSGGKELVNTDAGFGEWLKSRATTDVPRDFQRDQLKLISEFRHEADLILPKQSRRWSIFSILALLPGAQWRDEQRQASDALGAIRAAVEANNAEGVQKAIQLLDVTPKNRRTLATLLTRSNNSAVQLALMEQIIGEVDVWLLMAAHPTYTNVAWVSQPKAMDAERAFILWLLPESDLQAFAQSDFAFTRWKTLVQSTLEADDPVTILPVLLPKYQEVANLMLELGYPLRARRLAQFTTDIAKAYADQLPGEIQSLMKELEAFDSISIVPVENETVVEADQIPDVVIAEQTRVPNKVFEPAVVEAMADKLLSEAGALFMVKTTIKATSPNIATVDQIVFGGTKADRTLTFDIDVLTRTVNRITEAGKTYPYALSWEAFVDWVRK